MLVTHHVGNAGRWGRWTLETQSVWDAAADGGVVSKEIPRPVAHSRHRELSGVDLKTLYPCSNYDSNKTALNTQKFALNQH